MNTDLQSALVALRAELQGHIDAVDKLLGKSAGASGMTAPRTRTKTVRGGVRHGDKPKRKYTRRATVSKAEKVDSGPKRRRCPRCSQDKLYEAGRHHMAMCADCERKSDESRALLK